MTDQPLERPLPAPRSPSDKGDLYLPGAGTFATYLLIASLGMLFAASLLGFLYIRFTHQPWPPPGFPVLPRSLWLSTLVIITSSFSVQHALSAIRHGRTPALRRALILTLALGTAFLALQALAWWEVICQITSASESYGPYLNLFYFLTALHAAHVLGGLIPLALITRRATQNRYSPDFHPGVRNITLYWHFLDTVWCLLFTALYLL